MFNITNYSEHPTNPLYTVYRFGTMEEANLFKSLLSKDNLYHEYDSHETELGLKHLVAVKTKDESRATYLNYYVLGTYRKPFISDKKVQIFIYLLSLVLIGLAIIGFFLSS